MYKTTALTGLLGLILATAVGAAEAPPGKPVTVNPQKVPDNAAKAGKASAAEMEGDPRSRHEKRGDEYLDQGLFNEAINAFDIAIAHNPKADTAYVKKGIALYSSGRPEEAVPLMDKAMKVTRRGKTWTWWPLYHKGVAQAMSDDLKGALKSFNASIKRNPSHENYQGRARTYAQLEKLDKAVADARAALRHKPDDYLLSSFVSRLERQLDTQQKSKAFLKEMAARKGAQTTRSGLIYFELKEGDGKKPAAGDTVKAHYHGTLMEGKVFDSSVNRGEPLSFPLTRVIPCWTEGLQKMRVGGKARLICPAKLAYGERGVGSLIQPGAALQFEMELLGIE